MEKDNPEQEVNLFKKGELKNHIILIKTKDERVFGNVEGGGIFNDDKYPWVLKNEYVDNNLLKEIRETSKKYFDDNGIKWWGDKKATGDKVPGHTLSSQIACLNHLFRIKNDPEAVLAIVNGIRNEYDKVSPIPYDNEADQGFIAFEVTSDNEWLREDSKERKRGEFCTSIDALACAHHVPTGKNHIILIEWKYTESYDRDDKSKEDRFEEAVGTNGKGHERMSRYNDMIFSSKCIETPKNNIYEGSVFYQEPFYQLMRQTLWAEQVVMHRSSNNHAKKKEPIDACDYLHIHVIPRENTALLNKGFEKNGLSMEETWRKCLTAHGQGRYIVKDPQELLKPMVEDKDLADRYSDLIEYLGIRYWHKGEQKGKE